MEFPDWVVACGFGLVGAAILYFGQRVRRARPNPWPALPEPRKGDTCQRCHHWNLDEGQETLRRHPAFMQAAAVLTPNQMVRAEVDGEGNPNEGRKLLPLAEDKWQFMGACLGHGELRHRSDDCPHFVAAGSRAASRVEVGEGPGFAEPAVQLHETPKLEAMDLSNVEIIDREALAASSDDEALDGP